ncbi:MAG: hypothetical protein KAS72_12640 [Phycisphaerales bacterium]|nr:hypothetical protein [Phycisphaerales bacterium]
MSKRRTICWLSARQTELVRDAGKQAGLTFVAAGSSVKGQSAAVAETIGAEAGVDDLRIALTEYEADLIFLASIDHIDPETSDQLRTLAHRGVKVMSMEPLPGGLRDLTGADEPSLAELVPMMRRSPGFRAAELFLPNFGEVRCVNVSFRAGHGEGSLAARLYSALDVVNRLCGQAEQIDAAMAGPGGSLPETLALMHGHLTANLRFPENRAACIAVSDLAGQWSRGVTILGEGGCLRIADTRVEWIGQDGQVIDEASVDDVVSLGDLIATHIDRALDPRMPIDPPADHATILAVCEAALLSARTGQSESPRKLRKLIGSA